MNLFELAAVLTLDKSSFDKGLSAAGSAVSSFGNTVKSGLTTVAKVTGAAITAAGTAAVGLGKKVVSANAEYEQLKGGVQTLFGAGGLDLEQYAASVGKSVDEARAEYEKLMQAETNVLGNADAAYKTAGLSANDYIETVTSVSASLIQSVGGDTLKAADLANEAIIDMSDNANKMGKISIEAHLKQIELLENPKAA